MTRRPHAELCIHGHFYQPPRQDPFTGRVPREPGAEPYHDYNEKITAECYRPNAELSNFGRISFDLGPMLAAWLAEHHPATHDLIVAAASAYRRAHHVDNVMAQAFHHTILPLATRRDKLLQVRWGLTEFYHRFHRRRLTPSTRPQDAGLPPCGFWLPETAADEETLDVLAECGVAFTILAPWQAADHSLEVGRAYHVTTAAGRGLDLFFFDAGLSGRVSFDPPTTSDAWAFARRLADERRPLVDGLPPLVLVATDGELYGHHQPWRDLFLRELTTRAAPASGLRLTTPADFLARHPVRPSVSLALPSSWSCHHGVARWSTGCPCTPGDSSWKPILRRALDRLAARLDAVAERAARRLGVDLWAALNRYIEVVLGWREIGEFVRSLPSHALTSEEEMRLRFLLEGEYLRQRMFMSDAFFWEDLGRLETRYAIAYALRAIDFVARATGEPLGDAFTADLAPARSSRTGASGRDIVASLRRSMSVVR